MISISTGASQCCVGMEMAFELMQMKWGILCQPQNCLLKNQKCQVRAVACLHNIVMNERLGRLGGSADEAPSSALSHPVLLNGLLTLFPGWAELQEEMARSVETMGLNRLVGGKLN